MELEKKHILIVDDDTRICDLLQKFLSKNGYLVSAVHSAEQARQILAGLEFDLIILDVMMPRESGIELTSHLREKNKTPIILLTAKGDAEYRILGLEAGADDYLPKPFEPKELVLRIKNILKKTKKIDQDAPHNIILVLDATSGPVSYTHLTLPTKRIV